MFCKKVELCNFIIKETPIQLFPWEFCKMFKNTFFHITPLGDCFWDNCKLNLTLDRIQIWTYLTFATSARITWWEEIGCKQFRSKCSTVACTLFLFVTLVVNLELTKLRSHIFLERNSTLYQLPIKLSSPNFASNVKRI